MVTPWRMFLETKYRNISKNTRDETPQSREHAFQSNDDDDDNETEDGTQYSSKSSESKDVSHDPPASRYWPYTMSLSLRAAAEPMWVPSSP